MEKINMEKIMLDKINQHWNLKLEIGRFVSNEIGLTQPMNFEDHLSRYWQIVENSLCISVYPFKIENNLIKDAVGDVFRHEGCIGNLVGPSVVRKEDFTLVAIDKNYNSTNQSGSGVTPHLVVILSNDKEIK